MSVLWECRSCNQQLPGDEIDWESSFEIVELICFPCADIFWQDYCNTMKGTPMETEKPYEIGQVVTVDGNTAFGGDRMKIAEVRPIYTYRLKHLDGSMDTTGRVYYGYQLTSAPRLTPEEAWDDVKLFIGKREGGHSYNNKSTYDTATRAACYRILVSGGIKIVPEVKAKVVALISRAESEDFDG